MISDVFFNDSMFTIFSSGTFFLLVLMDSW